MGKVFNYINIKNNLLVPLSLFVLAFGLRYHFLTTYNYPLMIHEQDGVAYMDFAKQLLHWNLLNYTLPPLYPAIIAAFSFLPVPLEFAARLASITMDALTVIPLCYLAGKYLGPVGGFATGILWGFFSFSLYFTVSPLSQSSYLCCLLAGVALLYRGLEEELCEVWLIAAGACFAFAYLARVEGIIGFGGGLFLCLIQFLRKGKDFRSKVVHLFFYLSGFLVAAGPYLIFIHNRVGYWTISVRGEQELKTPDAVNTLNAAGTLVKNTTSGLSLWTKNFGSLSDFMVFVGNNVKGYFLVYERIFPLWVHGLCLVGVVLLIATKGWRRACYPILLLIVITPIFLLNIPKTPSYFYPVFPFVFICLLMGYEGVITGFSYVYRRYAGGTAAFILNKTYGILLTVPVFVLVPKFYVDADNAFQDPGLVQQAKLTEKIYKDAGEFILHNSAQGETVITRWGLVSYYADRPLMILPKGAVQDVVNFARKNGARFMVIDSIAVYSRRQELEELLNPLFGKTVNQAYGLHIIHLKVDSELGEGYVIYKLL
ncbi:MAG: glycosyltransferase family 39 protein [Proteobacteria bacterium]|nr:glycosyltransferase family 39 protein [Pseudomonadota bacterium]